ncbi:MAG: hypothetical protein ACOCV7_07165, partial [Desulfonatronovibrionaceae bacterium]
MITSRDKIETCLNTAMDQRTRFIIALPQEESGIHDLGGYLAEFSQDSMLLETDSRVFKQRWQELPLTCYFMIEDTKGMQKTVFFNFQCTVRETRKDRFNQFKLTVDFPESLNISQRRKSMRVEMDPRLVMGFSLWEEDRFIQKSSETSQKSLFSPLMTVDQVKSGSLRLINLSAGGIKAVFPNRLTEKLGQEWEKGHPLILWLVLKEPCNGQKLVFWLKARIKYIFPDKQEDSTAMGLEFTCYGEIDSN